MWNCYITVLYIFLKLYMLGLSSATANSGSSFLANREPGYRTVLDSERPVIIFSMVNLREIEGTCINSGIMQ
jgi:hypothetical protein